MWVGTWPDAGVPGIVNTIAHTAIPARAGIERHFGVHAGRSLARDFKSGARSGIGNAAR